MAGRQVAVKGTVDSHAREKGHAEGCVAGDSQSVDGNQGRAVVRNEAGGSAGAAPRRSFSVLLGVWASSCRQCRATEGVYAGAWRDQICT